MQKIGLTGGIGSGKTTVARLFEMLGTPVFYADLEAHHIRSRADVTEQIVQHLGTEILNEESRIDKHKLARVIFNNDEALQWLNNLLHPLVEEAFEEWCKNYEGKTAFVLMESALIFEAKLERLFDRIIVVDAPENLRIARVMNRENIREDEVLQRISKQMSSEEKRQKADFVIFNDEQHSLIEQCINVVGASHASPHK